MEAEIVKAAVLGAVQGISEFLPISSTAHLILTPWFMGWNGLIDTLSFDVALHGGTLAAILVYFYKDWFDIITKKHALLVLLIIATIPGAVLGKLFGDVVETALRSPAVISISLVTIGIFMLLAEKVSRKQRSVATLTISDAIILGLAQAVALIPGVSRSGITIAAGLVTNLKREEAAKMSFLMSAPIIAGATLLHTVEVFKTPTATHNGKLFMAGIITSFITGILSIGFLMKFFKKFSLNIFVYYRFILAIIILATLWIR
ncbi:MAG: undecaprenyl-diphosphate phosphatase [Candidatus Magnetoovum sp. WYHC-5]|nr:undecaprenyl-diphosphate phosphatase [Candidatus Magnetoovum sp. WYHC-5]